jgi:hypothetical protein
MMQSIVIIFMSIVATALFYETIIIPTFYQKHGSLTNKTFFSGKEMIMSMIQDSRYVEDCRRCREVILEFDRKFRGSIDKSMLLQTVEVMWQRLEMKYNQILNDLQVKENPVLNCHLN